MKKKNILFAVVMILFCGVLCLIPDERLNVTSIMPRVQVRITAVDNSGLYPVGIVYSGVQICHGEILTGELKGETCIANNYLNSALDKDKLYAVGDIAYAMIQGTGEASAVTLIDHYRAPAEGAVVTVLFIVLIAFGGLIGCGAVISLAASAVIVWKLLIPLLLDGTSPILAAFVTVVMLTVLIDLLVAGFSRQCAVALIGSLSGTLITCAMAVALTYWLKLDGGDLPYVVPLLAQSALKLDTRALYIGMLFIANSGALMDLSMDISVSCEEIQAHKPDISAREMLKSGLIIGRGVLGTMTTTLMLAYSGNYLSMLMYFAGQGTPLLDIINYKYIASQLLNTLVGSFGLVATAPVTAAIASICHTRRKACLAKQHEVM